MRPDLQELKFLCKEVRRDIVRMTHAAGSGHPGGSLSAVELLVGLYLQECATMLSVRNGQNATVYSLKGHAAPVLYSVLARAGYFPVEELLTLRQLGSRLQGHPHMLAPLD